MVDASTVSSLLLKLGDAALQEAITLCGVNDRVQFVEREMRRIGSFLEDADSKRRKGDKRVQNWIKDVRDVSFLIEDVIDTFDLGRNKGSFRSLGRVLKKPVVLYKLNKEINKIQTMLGEIERSRASYGIENLPESSTVAHVRRPINPEIDNIDVIGFGDERNAIIELLLDERTPRRSVVSIVGIGGLGKTTLAQKVYQSEKVKKHFEVSVWLNISQEFNIPNLLKKMADRLSIKLAENEQEEEQFIPKIKEVLKRKRYLVVLDDIWTGDVWSEMMMHALPDVNNGSRVLMTTRSLETAKAADPRNDPYKLRYLNDEESLDLLFKKAYVDQIANGSYPDDLLEPAKTISKKCGGLPLALIVAGGLLSTKNPTSVAWNKEIATMNWQRGENECMKILATSYEDLPINLKPCFVYLASFPEDWVYEAKLIIHLWVAEGFIPRDEPGTMEEIADKYLEELAQRCMIQNLERSLTNGSIKRFRVHDLLLDLAIQEAKQKSFLKVFSKRADFENNTDACRATFQLRDSSWKHSSFDQNKMIEYTKPNVRTLIFFGKMIPFDSQFKLLRVLMVQNCDFDGKQQSSLKNGLKGLTHLRCLALIGCYFEHYFYLPVAHLRNLQTIELQGVGNLVVSGPFGQPILQCLGRGLARADLPYLQSLDTLEIWKPAGIELLNMPSLVRLSLRNKTFSWKSIVTLLSKLNCLVYLKIFNENGIPLDIIDTSSFPSYNLLRTLYLIGEWPWGVTLNVDMFPPHLMELKLWRSAIDQDPMPILEKLQCLKVLRLSHNAYTGKQMICSRGGFPQLQKLRLFWLDELEEWKIEEGAMPMLNHITIDYCGMLKMLPDLQHVPTLNVLKLKRMPYKFKRRVKNEDQHKIEHIPSIIIDQLY